MGVFSVHPFVAMRDKALPNFRDHAAVRQLGYKGVPQGMKTLARYRPAFPLCRCNPAIDSRLLDEESELMRQAARSTGALSGQLRKNAR